MTDEVTFSGQLEISARSHTHFIIRARVNQEGVFYGVDRQEGGLVQGDGGVASLCEVQTSFLIPTARTSWTVDR